MQIAALDLTRSNLPALWLTHWDPTEPVASRPLSIRKNGTWYTYGHDLTKNITEFYNTSGDISTAYDYTPYGAVTAAGTDQPFQWSSEVYDAELGMVYYNYRHYNPLEGRWIGRDFLGEEEGGNLYSYVHNIPLMYCDIMGLEAYDEASEAFAAANKMVVEAMEKRYAQDIQKWNTLPRKKKIGRNKPVKLEFGVRICCKDCKYYVGEVGTSKANKSISPLSIPPCQNGTKMIGLAHSHPDKDSSLSDDDRRTAKNGYGNKLKIDEGKKVPKNTTITASVRDGNGNIRTSLYNPNNPVGKNTATFINGVRQ